MKAFRMVVDCQGFRAAATQMKLSPSLISRRILLLETEVNIQLIKRNSRQILLTPAGERFYKHCVSIIDEYELSLHDIRNLNNDVSGNLKVGIPHSISNLHIIPKLHEFQEQHPNLNLEIITGNHCLELFSHGYDLAIHCGPLPDCNLYFTLLGYWRKYTCASKRYVKKFGVPNHPSELSNHKCLQHFDNHTRTWNYMIEGKSVNIKIPSIVRVNNSLDLYQMVLNDQGISYLPDFTVKKSLMDGDIISLLDEFMPQPLPMYIVHINPHPSLKEKAFIDFIKSLNLAFTWNPASAKG